MWLFHNSVYVSLFFILIKLMWENSKKLFSLPSFIPFLSSNAKYLVLKISKFKSDPCIENNVISLPIQNCLQNSIQFCQAYNYAIFFPGMFGYLETLDIFSIGMMQAWIFSIPASGRRIFKKMASRAVF